MPDNDYTNLTPCTRFEEFLSGSDVEPANREEYFIQQAVNRLPFPESGSAGYVLAVDQDEEGYELVEPSGGADLPDLTGNAGRVLTVNSGATAVEWKAPNYIPAMNSDKNGMVLTCVYDGDTTYATWEAVGMTGSFSLDNTDYVLSGIDFYTIDSLLANGISIRFEEELSDGSFVYSSNFHYESSLSLDVVFTYYSGTDLYIDVYVLDVNAGTFTKTSRKVSTSAV